MAIIRYPTGVYIGMLPSKPSDVGSVLYVLSYLEPIRSTSQTSKIGIDAYYINETPIIPENILRAAAGQMVFQVSKSGNKYLSGADSLVYGQTLEFVSSSITTASQILPGTVETVHNNYATDLTKYGVDAQDQSQISTAASEAQDTVIKEIELKRVRKTEIVSKISIMESEKAEIQRAISGLEAIVSAGSSSLSPALDQLYAALQNRVDMIASLSQESSEIDTQIAALESSIKAISYLVR